MRNFLSVIGALLLVVAIILLVYLSVDYVRLSAAASTLNRSYPNPIGYVVLTAIVSLLSGLFFGLGLRSGRRDEPEISPRP
jgi:cell division protein FtsW (lipid II flippase)